MRATLDMLTADRYHKLRVIGAETAVSSVQRGGHTRTVGETQCRVENLPVGVHITAMRAQASSRAGMGRATAYCSIADRSDSTNTSRPAGLRGRADDTGEGIRVLQIGEVCRGEGLSSAIAVRDAFGRCAGQALMRVCFCAVR